ncbi:DNA pilot protein [Dipodfec virus RodF1_72]|uniref:DNA pilot protein n=1 Tax=Dipodfec virus RodF1_72 TaxID=2929309 RepID=A0A976N2C3_9VIRU|nr:DNA pilot protein [Dipodfec virus RodF1_72]
MTSDQSIAYAQAAIGQVIGAVEGKRAYKYTRKLMDLQYQNQLDFWRMNNEYNSPSSQMSRYAAAGVNPYMSLGNPNTSSYGSVMQSVPDYPRTSSTFMRGVEMQMTAALQAAQIKNIQANTALTSEKVDYQAGLTLMQPLVSRNLALDGDLKSQLHDFRSQYNTPQVALAWAQYNKLIADTDETHVRVSILGQDLMMKPLEKERLEVLISNMRKQGTLTDAQIDLVIAQACGRQIENTLRGAYLPYADDLASAAKTTAVNQAASSFEESSFLHDTRGQRRKMYDYDVELRFMDKWTKQERISWYNEHGGFWAAKQIFGGIPGIGNQIMFPF